MSEYPQDWTEKVVGDLLNTITDDVAAGSLKDL